MRLKLYIILSSRFIITKISSIYLPPNHLVAIDRLAAASYQQGIVQIRCVNDLDAYGWDSCGLAVAVEVCAHDASFFFLDNKSKFPATADLPPRGAILERSLVVIMGNCCSNFIHTHIYTFCILLLLIPHKLICLVNQLEEISGEYIGGLLCWKAIPCAHHRVI